jgi:hypothetical protein
MLYDKQKRVIVQEQAGLNSHHSNLQTHIWRCCFQWRNLHRGDSAWHAKIHSCNQGCDGAKRMPAETTIWAGAVDKELTSRSYIVPGLGDAGDLAYGSKQ